MLHQHTAQKYAHVRATTQHSHAQNKHERPLLEAQQKEPQARVRAWGSRSHYSRTLHLIGIRRGDGSSRAGRSPASAVTELQLAAAGRFCAVALINQGPSWPLFHVGRSDVGTICENGKRFGALPEPARGLCDARHALAFCGGVAGKNPGLGPGLCTC